jgi:hypothetical protein
MRLDRIREEEAAKRKGRARKTIIQLIWLLLSFVGAYFLTQYLFEQGVISYNAIYRMLATTPRTVPQIVITGGIMLIIVFIMQMFLFLGFFFASPEGRRRPGTPTLYSRNPDPLDPERFFERRDPPKKR